MMGPLWLSGQVFHSNSMVSPGLALAYSLPGVALLWQFTSADEALLGSTKPRSWFRESQPAVATRLFPW